jgi:hypothetical protein
VAWDGTADRPPSARSIPKAKPAPKGPTDDSKDCLVSAHGGYIRENRSDMLGEDALPSQPVQDR